MSTHVHAHFLHVCAYTHIHTHVHTHARMRCQAFSFSYSRESSLCWCSAAQMISVVAERRIFLSEKCRRRTPRAAKDWPRAAKGWTAALGRPRQRHPFRHPLGGSRQHAPRCSRKKIRARGGPPRFLRGCSSSIVCVMLAARGSWQ